MEVLEEIKKDIQHWISRLDGTARDRVPKEILKELHNSYAEFWFIKYGGQ